MFSSICVVISAVLLVVWVILELFFNNNHKSKSYRDVQPNCSDKWVYLPSHGLHLVKGDFWIGHNPKAEMPYQIVNVDCVLYEFKTKEEMTKALFDLSIFMDNSTKKVFYLDKYDDLWR